MASNTEHRAEIPIVKAVAKINAKIIIGVLLEPCRNEMYKLSWALNYCFDGALASCFKHYFYKKLLTIDNLTTTLAKDLTVFSH